MATVVMVMNMKGGAGKTTLCAHLAGMPSLDEHRGRHRRVLAIDSPRDRLVHEQSLYCV